MNEVGSSYSNVTIGISPKDSPKREDLVMNKVHTRINKTTNDKNNQISSDLLDSQPDFIGIL